MSSCSDNGTTGGDSANRSRSKHAKKKPDGVLTADWLSEYEDQLKEQATPGKGVNNVTGSKEKILKDAREAYHKKDWEKTCLLARTLVNRYPDMGEAYYLKGSALYYSAFGEEKEAQQDLEKAHQLKFQNPNLYESLARLYDSQKQYDKALKIVSYGIKIVPDKDLYRCRSALYLTVGDKDSALKDLNEYIKMSSTGSSLGYTLRAVLYEQMGRDQDAIDDYTMAIKSARNNTHILSAKARLLLKMGRTKEALAETEEITRVDRYDDDAFRLRGDVYLKMKQYDRAIAEYSQAINMSPDYARSAYEARSKAYEQMGKHDLAKKDRLEAMKQKAKPAEKPVYDLK